MLCFVCSFFSSGSGETRLLPYVRYKSLWSTYSLNGLLFSLQSRMQRMKDPHGTMFPVVHLSLCSAPLQLKQHHTPSLRPFVSYHHRSMVVLRYIDIEDKITSWVMNREMGVFMLDISAGVNFRVCFGVDCWTVNNAACTEGSLGWKSLIFTSTWFTDVGHT